MTDIPEPWATALVEAGFTDGRFTEPRPSLRKLAEHAGVGTSTISNMIYSKRRTEQDTIDRVAEALRADPILIAQWAGRERSEREPYRPHPDANLLDEQERRAINEVIGLLTKGRSDGQKMRAGDGEATGAIPVPSPVDDEATGFVERGKPAHQRRNRRD